MEVEPGRYAYGYHIHEVNEEVFYIIRGHAVVRTPEGEKNLKEGDAIAFPASPEGAHVIRNGSATEKLVYLDVGTRLTPDVVHFPDTAPEWYIPPPVCTIFGNLEAASLF